MFTDTKNVIKRRFNRRFSFNGDTMTKDFVYLDNGSTVFPKPQIVLDKMAEFYNEFGVNPGRGAFRRAKEAGAIVNDTRAFVADFFGGDDPSKLIFSANSSHALNIALIGLLGPGDHVISTNMEHNSVLRPLNALVRDRAVEVDYLAFNDDGVVPPEDFRTAIRENTKLVVVNHGSNVFGTVMDLEGIGEVCRENGLLFVVDSSQTAGVLDFDVVKMNIDVFCFTGHKSLLAPTGIGGLYINGEFDIHPCLFGGSGTRSVDPFMPQEYPERLEVGTVNTIGVAGLRAGIEWILQEGMENIHHREMTLYRRLVDSLRGVDGIRMFYEDSPFHLIPVLSVVLDRIPTKEAGQLLDERYGIATRAGCHCAPKAHMQAMTLPNGTIRFSIGPFTDDEDIDIAAMALKTLAQER